MWLVIRYLSCFARHLCKRNNGLIDAGGNRSQGFESTTFNHSPDVSRDCWFKSSRTNSDAVIGLQKERALCEPKCA